MTDIKPGIATLIIKTRITEKEVSLEVDIEGRGIDLIAAINAAMTENEKLATLLQESCEIFSIAHNSKAFQNLKNSSVKVSNEEN